jgi:CheY-like chemotaxis protein
MNGPTATKEIRALGYDRKIFGVTGNAVQSDIDIFIQSGATAVYPKPVDMVALLQAI